MLLVVHIEIMMAFQIFKINAQIALAREYIKVVQIRMVMALMTVEIDALKHLGVLLPMVALK